jgi:predicted small secreted protein
MKQRRLMVSENKPMILVFMLAVYLFITGCATVDGMRTDVATGVTKVADWIKPCENTECKKDE